MNQIELVNLRGGGALPTIRKATTHRARKAMHRAGNHDQCVRPEVCKAAEQ